jgi:hypothetical protein
MMWDPAQRAQVEARLFARIDVGTSPAGCWMWTGNLARGYGVMRVGGRYQLVHRLVYELLQGEIPNGLHLDHLCREEACVNLFILNRSRPGRTSAADATTRTSARTIATTGIRSMMQIRTAMLVAGVAVGRADEIPSGVTW